MFSWVLIPIRILSEALFIFFISPEFIRGFYWLRPRVNFPVLHSKCNSEFTQSRPPGVSPNSLDRGLPVHLWVQFDLGLQLNLQTSSITASMCISELHDLGLQMHLQTCFIPASKCISELLEFGIQIHLQPRSITASKCISEFNSITACICISKLTPSRPPSTSPSSHDHGLQVHL